jgi:prephenate dehydrogenase
MRLRDSHVTIIGLGQMGASIGRALIARRACRLVTGAARKASTRRTALRLRAAHRATDDLTEACDGADLVILATPARTILRQIYAAVAAMKPGSLLIDVGSSKGLICRTGSSAVRGTDIGFIGGHPMAGQSGSGPSSSDPGLFTGRPFVLCPAPGTRPSHKRMAAELVAAVRARSIVIDPSAHDRAVALISHLPHAIAVALIKLAADEPTRLPLRLAAGSFACATRVATSDTDMLLDLLLTNAQAVSKSIAEFQRILGSISGLIRRGQEAKLRRLLAKARSNRSTL